MAKKSKKRTSVAIKSSAAPISHASAYAANLAKRVAADMTPMRTRKKGSR